MKKKSEEGIEPYVFPDVQRDFDRMTEKFQREFEDFWELPPMRHVCVGDTDSP